MVTHPLVKVGAFLLQRNAVFSLVFLPFFVTLCPEIMKQMLLYTLLAAVIMTMGACKEKKQMPDVLITDKYEPKKLQAPIRMPENNQVNTVNWQGHPYQVEIRRVADDSLAMLKDDNGQEYVDNRIDLTIKRQDGSVFFSQIFTKSSFVACLEEPFRGSGQLTSIRFDSVDNSAIEFTVVIGLPDAVDDLFVPLEMTVDRQGFVKIEQDNDMDMLDYDVDVDDD